MKTIKLRSKATKTGVLTPKKPERATRPRAARASRQTPVEKPPEVVATVPSTSAATGTPASVYQDNETARLVREAIAAVKAVARVNDDAHRMMNPFREAKGKINRLMELPKCAHLTVAIKGLGYSLGLSSMRGVLSAAGSTDVLAIKEVLDLISQLRKSFLECASKVRVIDEEIMALPELDAALLLERFARNAIDQKPKGRAPRR